jgi:enoyl-CoA hydratase/carnithine racemase
MVADDDVPPATLDDLLRVGLPLLGVRRDPQAPGVVVLTLADPDRRNAMSLRMTASWRRALAAVGADPDVRVVVLTGAGTAFSSGGDLSWLGDDTGPGASVDRLRTRMAGYYADWLRLLSLPVPVVAAVQGPAVGAGAGLALACDLRLCARSAHLAVPFTALGLHPGMGLSASIAHLAGPTVAHDLLLTGRRVDADEAQRVGLVTEVHDDDSVLAAALERARTIASRAPVATRLTTATLRADLRDRLEEATRWEALAQATTLATADAAEGLAAAAGRRAPVFTGC